MTYEEYIASPQWQEKRAAVISRDEHCQTCQGVEKLEVHHKTYAHLFNEPLNDLITLCHECHEAITAVIRRRKYSKWKPPTDSWTPNIQQRKPINEQAIGIHDPRDYTSHLPQRADRRPAELLLERDEENIGQARQDGS